MSRISVFILVTAFITSNQRRIWKTEEDVSTMPQTPIINPNLNKSFEYNWVDCDVLSLNLIRGQSVGFEFWNGGDEDYSCRIKFLVPARKKIKLFCENFDIPSAGEFCVYDTRFREKRGNKKCYYGKKQEVMIPFPEPEEDARFVIKFKPLPWRTYPGQGASCVLFTDESNSQPPNPPKPQPPVSEELCNCGVAQKTTSGNRIIGGNNGNATFNEYPWQAFLQITLDNGKYRGCGGSLISNQHILTAAHCTEGASGISHAFLGEHDLNDIQEHAVTISRITDHPDYNSYTYDNDLSVLTLTTPVSFSPSMLPICLPGYVGKSYKGEVATVTGWGHTISGDAKSRASVLQEVNVTVWSNDQCRKAYHGKNTNINMCASDKGKDSCQGDSGGPLFYKENGRFTQIGVVSHGPEEGQGALCDNPDFPGVYARVSDQTLEWIKDKASGTQKSTCDNPIKIGMFVIP